MVDSEECGTSTGHLVDIADDNEYFKKMWSLVPPLFNAEVEPEEDDSKKKVLSEAKLKKKMEREKKREKRRKKEQTKTNEDDVKQMSKKQARDEDAEDYTTIKSKKQKVNHQVETSPVNNVHSSSDSDVSFDSETESPKPVIVSKPVQNIPVKSKTKKEKAKIKKHGEVKKPDVIKEIENISNENSAVNEQSDSQGAIENDISEGDILQTASISSIEEKREKLRAKIEELQAKRKPSNKERLEKKKLKRQESKMKLKQKRKLEKMQNKQNKQNGEVSKSVKGNTSKGMSTPSKPVYNKEGQMVFSKFDFTDSAKKEKHQTELHGKDYKRLLEKIEKRNEKINKVKSKDEGAGKALEDKFKWESVMHKAEGEKVKDNPELLKKALKRKQKMKDQKKKKWENRTENVEKQKDEKQKKRTENIQKRKQNMKDKKIKKLKKKGRVVPGF